MKYHFSLKDINLKKDIKIDFNNCENQYEKAHSYFAILIIISMHSHAQWEECNNGLYGSYIESFGISNNKIFALAGGNGIFLSIDTGNTWIEKNSGLNNSI